MWMHFRKSVVQTHDFKPWLQKQKKSNKNKVVNVSRVHEIHSQCAHIHSYSYAENGSVICFPQSSHSITLHHLNYIF